MKRIAELVGEGRILVSDGAWGTQLQARGLKAGECPEAWCAERADAVLDVARSYIEAGADMIKTNSFGASRMKLDLFGLAERAVELNEAAARISRSAAGADRNVMASVGPTGRMLMMGETTEDELYEVFREQVCALERGGADACLIETMSAIDEATVAIRAARDNTPLEIVCTFTFERTAGGEYRTMMGVLPGEMAAAITAAGAHVIGANCGNGSERMVEIARQIRRAVPGIPIVVHSNAGMPSLVRGKTVFPETPEETASFVPALIEAGVNIVGGCCGTTPAHIAAIAAKVGGLRSK